MPSYKYVTNIALDNSRGGWSSLNHKVYLGLSNVLSLSYIKIDNPDFSFITKWKSRLVRYLGYKGEYFYYSKNRLRQYENLVKPNIDSNDVLIFFGSTPWINLKLENKYYVVSDISFAGYYKHYNKDNFMNSDIERIINQEKEFLSKAESVFITSEWAKNEMISAYNLNESLVFNIGIAGNLEEKFTIPVFKTVKLLFIANNFKIKGGEDLLQAFLVIQSRYPNTELNIIGAKPTHSIKGINNLNYHGFLDKTNPKQLELYILLLSESDLLIMPTKSDAAPLTIIEAGYVGTPSIAPKRFAIPELVKECISGYLLPEKFIIDDIVSAIEKYILLSNHKKINLRKTTYDFHIKSNWSNVIKRIKENID